MKKTIKIFAVIMIALSMLCLVACNNVPTGKAAYDTSASGEGVSIRMSVVKEEIDSMKVEDFEPSDQQSDYVLIKVKDYGEIVLVLRSDVAPGTVKNFKKLVADGFYTGTVFHRVIENFMIQGGGFTDDDPGIKEKPALYPPIKGEFLSNGVKNPIKHKKGVISMARTMGNNSATSQFFICSADCAFLDGQYASFGKVVDDDDISEVVKISEVKTHSWRYFDDIPDDAVVIKTIKILD
jgi:peptidyl-prolyl cis-trans isomerase B (cyclophilin B)